MPSKPPRPPGRDELDGGLPVGCRHRDDIRRADPRAARVREGV